MTAFRIGDAVTARRNGLTIAGEVDDLAGTAVKIVSREDGVETATWVDSAYVPVEHRPFTDDSPSSVTIRLMNVLRSFGYGYTDMHAIVSDAVAAGTAECLELPLCVTDAMEAVMPWSKEYDAPENTDFTYEDRPYGPNGAEWAGADDEAGDFLNDPANDERIVAAVMAMSA